MGPYGGGQAELLRVPWTDFNCLVLPESPRERQLDYVMLADIFPTGWHATQLACVQPGDTVVIYGAGPVGLMAALRPMQREELQPSTAAADRVSCRTFVDRLTRVGPRRSTGCRRALRPPRRRLDEGRHDDGERETGASHRHVTRPSCPTPPLKVGFLRTFDGSAITTALVADRSARASSSPFADHRRAAIHLPDHSDPRL